MATNRAVHYGKYAVFGLLGLVAFTFAVMWLWNWLVPDLFQGPEVNYWQTLGLLVLSKILFSGMHPGHGHSAHAHPHLAKNHPHHAAHERWKRKFQEKFDDTEADSAGTP
ncbi:MAG: hypothetical protein R2751_15940 [Bacteroidales bacterium]